MVKTVDTLVQDIYDLFKTKQTVNEGLVKKLGEDIAKTVADRLASEEYKRTLRMSNIGRPTRQVWYEIKDYPKEEPLPFQKIKFLYGDILEHILLFLAEAAGHTVEDRQKSVSIDGIVGHIDAVIDGQLVDCKSVASPSFSKFEDRGLLFDDPFGYIPQLSGYSLGTGIKECAFLAIDKQLGKITLMKLDEDNKVDVKPRIQEMKEAVNSDAPPPRCYEPVPDGESGNMKLPVGCAYCPFKHTCWKDCNDGKGLRTFFYSTGPRYLTTVVKEPKVNEKGK